MLDRPNGSRLWVPRLPTARRTPSRDTSAGALASSGGGALRVQVCPHPRSTRTSPPRRRARRPQARRSLRGRSDRSSREGPPGSHRRAQAGHRRSEARRREDEQEDTRDGQHGSGGPVPSSAGLHLVASSRSPRTRPHTHRKHRLGTSREPSSDGPRSPRRFSPSVWRCAVRLVSRPALAGLAGAPGSAGTVR